MEVNRVVCCFFSSSMGDFSDILNSLEKNNSTSLNYHCMAYNPVKPCGLIDMGYNCPTFTWCNECFTFAPTYGILDHCFANVEWCKEFPNTSVYNLPIFL